MNRKSQASLEYLFVIGLVILIIAIASAMFFMKSYETSKQTDDQLIEIIATDILVNAERIYYASPGSTLLLNYEIPDIVHNISVVNNHELVFVTATSGVYSEKVYYSTVPITGVFPTDYEDTAQISKFVIMKNQSNDIIVCTPDFGC